MKLETATQLHNELRQLIKNVEIDNDTHMITEYNINSLRDDILDKIITFVNANYIEKSAS